MLSNSSARLPSVGTVFPTLNAFKLAAHQAAHNEGYQLRIFDSTRDRQVRLSCIGLGTRKQLRSNGRQRCTCQVYARKGTAGGFSVRSVSNQHTCDLACRTTSNYEALRTMGVEVKDLAGVLVQEQTRRGSRSRSCGRSGLVDMSEVDDEDDDIAREDSEASYGAHETSSDENESFVSAKKGNRSNYTKTELRAKSWALAETRRLGLPVLDQAFPSLLAVMLHVYAWALQQGLFLTHNSYIKRIVWVCHPNSGTGRCPFEIAASGLADGTWSITHVHPIHDERPHLDRDKVEPDASIPKKANLSLLPVPSSPSHGSSSPVTLSPPSTASRSQPRTVLPPPHAEGNVMPPSLQAPPALSPNDLSSCFLALFPTATNASVESFSSILTTGGVSTVQDLALLVQLEEDTLRNLVEEVEQSKGLKEQDSREAKKTLEAIRTTFG